LDFCNVLESGAFESDAISVKGGHNEKNSNHSYSRNGLFAGVGRKLSRIMRKNMRMLYDLSVAAYLIVDARVTDGPKFFEMYYDQERYIPVQLRRGKKYLFLVAGEDRVTDLDPFHL
jgi:hypothetical protein